MKRIAVFDLDGTLIAGDSLRRLILASLTREPRLLAALAARAARLSTRAAFAARAHELLAPRLARKDVLEDQLRWIESRLVAERMEEMRRRKASGAAVILMSASPEDYVAPLGARLGFDTAMGSAFDGGVYRHLYGSAKIRALDARFPKGEWRWEFAIADSPSDESLLGSFETARRV
jgi:phosphoserine phosphatase